MKMRRLLIILGVAWLAVACKPAVPTLPPTSTPTRTVERAAAPSATPVKTRATVSASPVRSKTPEKPTEASVTIMPTPSPTVNPLACLPNDPGVTGMVSWVIDGSTFVIDLGGRQETVRLLGVTALPLTVETTRSLLDRRVVRLVSDGPNTDIHGRLLRYALLLDGRFINDDLLRNGAARLDPDIRGLTCMVQLAAAEKAAIQNGLGLWAMTALAELPTALLPSTSPEVSLTPTTVGALSTATMATSANTPVTVSMPSASNTPLGATTNPTQPGQVITPSPTSTVAMTGVQIVDIFYDGVKGEGEPDEYIEIKNFNATPVNISYWLINAEVNELWYIFPEFIIQPGQTCRIYTNEVHPDSCVPESFLMPMDNWPVWDNTADCGTLFNYAQEAAVSKRCYGL